MNLTEDFVELRQLAWIQLMVSTGEWRSVISWFFPLTTTTECPPMLFLCYQRCSRKSISGSMVGCSGRREPRLSFPMIKNSCICKNTPLNPNHYIILSKLNRIHGIQASFYWQHCRIIPVITNYSITQDLLDYCRSWCFDLLIPNPNYLEYDFWQVNPNYFFTQPVLTS